MCNLSSLVAASVEMSAELTAVVHRVVGYVTDSKRCAAVVAEGVVGLNYGRPYLRAVCFVGMSLWLCRCVGDCPQVSSSGCSDDEGN